MSEDWAGCFSEPFELTPLDTGLTDNNIIKLGDRKTSFICFDCLGDVNVEKIEVHSMGYLSSIGQPSFFNQKSPHYSLEDDKFGVISLFDREWDKASAFYKLHGNFFKMTSKEMMMIEQGASLNVSVLGNNIVWSSNSQRDYRQSRFHCLHFLHFFHNSLALISSKSSYSWMLKELFPSFRKHLKALRRQLGRLINLPDYVYDHAANSNGNKCHQASYHLLHLHLDLRWLHLGSLLILANPSLAEQLPTHTSSSMPQHLGSEAVLVELQFLILELLELSIKRFEKTELSLLKYKSPFGCTCVQELWMLIMKVIIKLCSENRGKDFWDFISLHLDTSLIYKCDEFELSEFIHGCFKNKFSKFSIFSLWFLYHISRLHNYITKDSSSNYVLLESNLKRTFSNDVTEVDLRIELYFIEKLCLEVWEPKADVLLILWDYFHKKINSSFYITGAPPCSLAVISKTPLGLLNQVKSFLADPNSISYSFQHFLRIIGLHLQKTKSVARHWNLLRGRMYSKLTLAKLETLSNIGEYHFVSLFLMLAISQDIHQPGSKMVEIINSYYMKKKYLSDELTKGELALALLMIERGEDASAALQPVASYIQSVPIFELQDLMRVYVETFQEIINIDRPLSLGQHLLIDKWISEYLSSSSKTDVSRLLDTLVDLLRRLKLYSEFCTPEHNVIVMIEKLWDELRKFVEDWSIQHETPYQVSEIAASLAAISLQLSNRERFIDIVNMFVNRTGTEIGVLRQFVCNISQNEGIKNVLPNYDRVILKTWLKCCFLCSDMEHSEMRDLTRTAIELPEMQCLLADGLHSLVYSSQPLLDFFSALHNKYTTEDIWKRQALREKVFVYLEGIEKWIKPIISPPRDSGKIHALYNTVGNMVRLISPLLYIKSRANTLLQQLLDLLLLPISVRNPETKIHAHILSAVKASLHLFIEGLLYINSESDHYISRVLKELLIVYIPHCMNTQNQNALNYGNFKLIPYFSNFDNSSRQLLLEIVTNNFFKKKSKNAHPSALSALKFLKEILNSHWTAGDVLRSIVRGSLERVCDVVMFSEDRSIVNQAAKDLLKIFLNSQTLRATQSAMDDFFEVLKCLCEEHLAWSSRKFFDLLVFMCGEAPDLVRRFTPILQQQVQLIEAKRGVGYDRTLRLGLERIEMNLRAIKEAV